MSHLPGPAVHWEAATKAPASPPPPSPQGREAHSLKWLKGDEDGQGKEGKADKRMGWQAAGLALLSLSGSAWSAPFGCLTARTRATGGCEATLPTLQLLTLLLALCTIHLTNSMRTR